MEEKRLKVTHCKKIVCASLRNELRCHLKRNFLKLGLLRVLSSVPTKKKLLLEEFKKKFSVKKTDPRTIWLVIGLTLSEVDNATRRATVEVVVDELFKLASQVQCQHFANGFSLW